MFNSFGKLFNFSKMLVPILPYCIVNTEICFKSIPDANMLAIEEKSSKFTLCFQEYMKTSSMGKNFDDFFFDIFLPTNSHRKS